MFNPAHYTYRVIWSEGDQSFIGLVAEFPSLSFLNEHKGTAFSGIVDLVGQVMTDMIANDEPLPAVAWNTPACRLSGCGVD